MLPELITTKLNDRLARFVELEQTVNSADGALSPNYPDVLREYGTLREAMEKYRAYQKLLAAAADNHEIAENPAEDAEMRQLAKDEIAALAPVVAAAEAELNEMIFGKTAEDNRNVMVEIRAGTGGEEAALFAGDLLRMYMNYAGSRGWKVEEVSLSPSEQGGIKEVVVSVQGAGAFSALKYEGGGHRVQRVPETENQGRIHTSAATVAVLPEVEEYEIEIKPQDLRIETIKSTGPGGQNVNKTESAIRILHIPTGLIVHVGDEKSQNKNKSKAMRVLRARLSEMKKREEEAARAKERREQVGSGDRSERIRTYNFPQDRCSDHRLNRNFSLSDIIAGKLDKLVEALQEYDKQQAM
ncbi:peptide chain release factor 1 [Planctomycetales bacterium]|nr:peptide chain release factor 1 [Planctomycetales bacterium]GHT03409.1 peptide chain release factor 1 [Planctomycetales bacterium]GHV19131.1 peptide chain release factor 1 [Planctomycetales bacterium]